MKRRYLLAIFMSLIPFSCTVGKGDVSEKDALPEYEIVKEYERGPLNLVVRVSREEISIAENIRFELEARLDQEYSLTLPSIGENLSEFSIKDYSIPPPQLEGGDIRLHTRRYILEPFLSGEYTIPGLQIVFQKDGQEEPHEFYTDDISITVQSLLPEDLQELSIHGIIGPVDEAAVQQVKLWHIGSGVLLLAGIGTFLVLQRRKKKAAVPVQIPPNEIARRQLEELLQEELVEKGRIKIFYRRISDILRHYIENQFGLHAPEQTTEEFLQDLRTGGRLETAYQKLLSDFLIHCDLVKFAEYDPSSDEIERTFNSCTNFIFASEVKTEDQ